MPNYTFASGLRCIIAKAFAVQDEVLSLKYISTKRDKLMEYDLKSRDWISEDIESILQNHIDTTLD